ncbi:LamG-like jellyroll fold domain-containing protein [Flavobacterium xylosi]|uniref:LamG-like jellyroll fold domain-containing protein n=1 Tax=Flavobacterium xylosi TaxID=3230415 RepID=UPI0036D3E3C8
MPTGVTGNWAANVVTISGSPSTTVGSPFSYTVTTTGGCTTPAVTATGTITVTPNMTVAAASSTPTLCINTLLTNITHATTLATSIGSPTGLPAGVTAAFASNTITISGTPTASGTFNYSIPLTGGCGNVNATGTITVTPNNTATASTPQTKCINIALSPNLTHTTTGATGIGSAVGLPAGVTAAFASNTITISGTPTASGSFNYSIPLTGGCGSVNAIGTITVTLNNTVGVASTTPTLCISTLLTNITHTTTGATGIGAPTGLPAGVTAAFASNTITISGTPTASGTFNYSIPLTGGCGTVNATGTITVTPNMTATSSTPQTKCINTVLSPNLTHTTTLATGIGTPTGLPAGVTASFASNTITISGTPTVSGTFNYSIPLTGGCGNVNATGTITVTPNNTFTLGTSGTDIQTICINTLISNIVYDFSGNPTAAIVTGLPSGVTDSYASGPKRLTISGLPTVSGTFNYTITLTGGCGTFSGTITVTPNNTVGVASSAPTLCTNTLLPNITHTTTGAAGIGFTTGLPAGVTAAFASNTITISGTPTASGTFNYSIPLTGGCGNVNATGTIIVTPNNTATASTPQTRCINIALSPNLTHTTTRATGIGVATGLPSGVTAAFASNTITISGTPTASGVFAYSIPLTGGCGTVNATGTITVTPNNTITRTSAVGTDAQTRCINTAITNITYSTTGATGATFIGLPTGVTGNWAANVVTISGSPSVSVASPYNYSVTLTGGCGNAIATGSITVNPLPTGSALNQTICNARTSNVALNSTIIGTTFTWTAALITTPTSGTITGFSDCPGACGTTISQTLTNSGTTAGVIRYTVTPTANNCSGSTFTVNVTVNPKPIITLSNVTAQCSTTLTAPTFTDTCGVTVTGTTGDTTTYNTQGTYTVVWSFAFGTVITSTQTVIIDDTIAPVASTTPLPALTYSGCQIDNLPIPTATNNCPIGVINGTPNITFPFTTLGLTVVTWSYNDGNGNTATQTQNVTLTAPPISGGTLLGKLDVIPPAVYTPTDNIAISSCPNDSNPVTINLSGEIGTIVRWEKFEAGDTQWSIIKDVSNNPITTNVYNIVFNFNNTKSTLFRVLVQVGNCTQYSNMVNVHAIPPDVPPVLDQNLFNICLNEQVSLVARSGYTSTINAGNGGDFNLGQFPNKWDPTQWKIDGEVSGTAWTAAANNAKVNNWTGTNDSKRVGTSYIIEYDNGILGKKFGMAHGNYNSNEYTTKFGVGPTTLETPIFSLEGLAEASICFDQAYNLHAGDYAKLELSLDGGTTYNIPLQELIGKNPPLTWDWDSPENKPPSTSSYYMFANDNSCFDLYEYIKTIPSYGLTSLRVKWTFFGTTDESVWAIDNITIPVKPYYDEVEWTDGLGTPGEYIIRGKLEVAIPITPTAPGVHKYGATSLINGCRAYDPDGTALATVKVNYSYAGEAQAYTNEQCGERTVQLNAYDNTKTAKENFNKGAYPSLVPKDPAKKIDYNDDPGTGATGTWSVFNTTNTCGTYSFSDVSSPISSFSGDSGVYTLRWRVGSDTAICDSFVQVTLTNCDVVDFDGVDDYIAFKNNYGLTSAFSIEVWVKPDPQPINPPSIIQTIISKRNANSLIDGYDIRLVGSTLTFNWNNGSKITSSFPLTTSRWYHVAVTYSGGIYILYVDGIEVVRSAGSQPTTNSFECIAGAMDQTGNTPNKPVNHFSGWMDELRVWDVGLSPDHVRQMMNQQIINNGTAVRGEIIPIDVNGPDTNKDGIDDQPISWANLKGYYRMNQIDCGYLKPFAGKGVDGKLRNITSSQEETAPLPYVSIRDGNWMDTGSGTTPWKYGDSVWDYPNSTGFNGTLIDWNIVQTGHNISSGNKDITILGLISTAGKLTIADPVVTTPIEKNDGQGLWITHYLKLNGNIDLVGESQLVQKRYGTYNSSNLFTTNQFSESIFEVASSGYIERDQQGKQNSFNYNYWSSPVSIIQGVINNTPYSLTSILRDGTNSADPKTINFVEGAFSADGAVTIPIKISNRWLWSYNSQTLDLNTDLQDYNQWNYIGSTLPLNTGEGFTMKGTGGTAAIDVKQNHVFVGKPNSGTISLNISQEQTYLIGNPYPSALDADEFIKDNLAGRAGFNVFNGALYFWDHFGLSNNHELAEYEGGYATYTLTGGVPGINDSSLTLNNGASGLKAPGRYIPVAQGFFVDAALDPAIIGTTSTVQGGTINFKNSQRVFMRENLTSSMFLKTGGDKSNTTDTDTRLKIRLGFDSPVGAHRQLLVGADPNSTNQFDLGYDAPMFDTNDNDMYWELSDSQFVIQAIPNFNDNQIIPLGFTIAKEGLSTIKIDALENMPNTTKIYLHDNLTSIYHDLRESALKVSLAIGEYNNRFSLRFADKTLKVDDFTLPESILVYFTNNTKTLNIKNKFIDGTVNKVFLFNLLGQSITNWDVEDQKQNNIQIPIKNVPSGVYIVKVKTTKGDFSKKIIIR